MLPCQNHGIELEIGTTLAIAENIEWQGDRNSVWNRNEIHKTIQTELHFFRPSLRRRHQVPTFRRKKFTNFMGLQIRRIGHTQEPQNLRIGNPVSGSGRRLFAFADGFSRRNATTYMLDIGTKVAPYTLGSRMGC